MFGLDDGQDDDQFSTVGRKVDVGRLLENAHKSVL